MGLTLAGKVKMAQNIAQIADYANSLQLSTTDLIDPVKKKRHDADLNVLRAGIDRLTTGDTISTGNFALNCNFPTLQHFAVRSHMKKFGIQSLNDIKIFLQVLAIEPYPENQIAQKLLHDMFKESQNAFTVPKLSFELKAVMEKLGEIVLLLGYVQKDRFDPLPTLNIFASDVVDAIVRKIFDGETPHYFLESTNIAAQCCDLVVAITQRRDVTVDILLDVLRAPIFLSDHCRGSIVQAPYIGATYDVFLTKFITLFEKKNSPLSYDHLMTIARNIVDEKNGGRDVTKRENFVIRKVLPLIIMGHDPVHFANKFFARTSAHRFISAYLQVCNNLTNDHLRGLAECVLTGESTGDDAAAKLFTAKRRFGLDVDVAQILKKSKDPKIVGIAIMIDGSNGIMDAAFEEFTANLTQFLRNRKKS